MLEDSSDSNTAERHKTRKISLFLVHSMTSMDWVCKTDLSALCGRQGCQDVNSKEVASLQKEELTYVDSLYVFLCQFMKLL